MVRDWLVVRFWQIFDQFAASLYSLNLHSMRETVVISTRVRTHACPGRSRWSLDSAANHISMWFSWKMERGRKVGKEREREREKERERERERGDWSVVGMNLWYMPRSTICLSALSSTCTSRDLHVGSVKSPEMIMKCSWKFEFRDDVPSYWD